MKIIALPLVAVLLALVSACEAAPSALPTVLPSPVEPSLIPTSPTAVPYPPPPTPAPYTPGPTFTPWPTWTSLPPPTATPVPTIVPPIHTATAGQLPRITHDLLFLSQSSLMRWDHTTGRIEALVTPDVEQGEGDLRDKTVAWTAGRGGPDRSVTSFSISADGRKIALVRFSPPGISEISVLDVRTRRVTALVPAQAQSLSRVAISPDGQWVAYIQTGSLPTIPTPDGHSIAWSDGRGVWVAELGQTGRLLVINAFSFPRDEPRGTFKADAWSPLGRYLLAHISQYEDGRLGVIDTEMGHAAVLPDTSGVRYPGTDVAWMRDGRLFLVRPSGVYKGEMPNAEIWRVDGSLDPMLIRDARFPLGVGAENYPVAPIHLADSRLAFAGLNLSGTNYAERGLYFVGLNDLVPHKVAGLPPVDMESRFFVNVLWSPDGVGAIFEERVTVDSRMLLYVPTDSSPLIDLRPIMDDGEYRACCFVWLR